MTQIPLQPRAAASGGLISPRAPRNQPHPHEHSLRPVARKGPEHSDASPCWPTLSCRRGRRFVGWKLSCPEMAGPLEPEFPDLGTGSRASSVGWCEVRGAHGDGTCAPSAPTWSLFQRLFVTFKWNSVKVSTRTTTSRLSCVPSVLQPPLPLVSGPVRGTPRLPSAQAGRRAHSSCPLWLARKVVGRGRAPRGAAWEFCAGTGV